MKSFSMNRVLSTIKKRPTFGGGGELHPHPVAGQRRNAEMGNKTERADDSFGEPGSSTEVAAPDPSGESPEATAARCVVCNALSLSSKPTF